MIMGGKRAIQKGAHQVNCRDASTQIEDNQNSLEQELKEWQELAKFVESACKIYQEHIKGIIPYYLSVVEQSKKAQTLLNSQINKIQNELEQQK